MNRALLPVLLALLPAALQAQNPPEYHAEDPRAVVVTEENLLASERFWPYHVGLTKPWAQAGRAQPLRPGTTGVLIRVEESRLARIDFGRDGLYEVPVGTTDIVERANRVRLGELRKMAPNFVLAIGPRLVDPGAASLRPFLFETVSEQQGFLTVFADPGTASFADLAAALVPLSKRHGVMTVLFPEGEHPDAQLREKLRSLGWTVPFVYDHLAEAYTRSLLPEKASLPALMLQTREGRVLFQSSWKPAVMPQLTSALDAAFGTSPIHKSAAIE